jgi:hypothetical protein
MSISAKSPSDDRNGVLFFFIDKTGGWQWWQCGSAQFKFQRLFDLGESADEAMGCSHRLQTRRPNG